MSTVHLLGRPRVEGGPGDRTVRSRKSWALLAYLLLTERPPSRAQLAGLLFEEADDPLGALRGRRPARRGSGGATSETVAASVLARPELVTPTASLHAAVARGARGVGDVGGVHVRTHRAGVPSELPPGTVST